MSKRSVRFHWFMSILLAIIGIGAFRSAFAFAGIAVILCAILYLPVPPISRLWTRSRKSRILTGTAICALLFVTILSNGLWIPRNTHPETIQTAPVSTSSGEMLPEVSGSSVEPAAVSSTASSAAIAASSAPSSSTSAPEPAETAARTQDAEAADTSGNSFDLSTVPAYSGSPYAEVNGNRPFFSSGDLTTQSYENYGELDSLGRCTTATACIGRDLMPTEKRGDIGFVKPTGWHTVKYAGIDGNYLYNRCHLIGYQLTGENANEKNLVTGTRYMNVEGMEPFESMTADYIKETGNHVLYRVTPIFEGNNLVASGVLMEAESVEDNGAGILFCVYYYNVQPGVTIDYATGDSTGPEFTGSGAGTANTETTQAAQPEVAQNADNAQAATAAYIGNSNSMKFHKPDCPSVAKMSDSNKVEFSTRDEAVADGYQPCKQCNP